MRAFVVLLSYFSLPAVVAIRACVTHVEGSSQNSLRGPSNEVDPSKFELVSQLSYVFCGLDGVELRTCRQKRDERGAGKVRRPVAAPCTLGVLAAVVGQRRHTMPVLTLFQLNVAVRTLLFRW